MQLATVHTVTCIFPPKPNVRWIHPFLLILQGSKLHLGYGKQSIGISPFSPKQECSSNIFTLGFLPFWVRVQTFPSILRRLNCFHTQIWAWYPAVITYHSKPQLTKSVLVTILEILCWHWLLRSRIGETSASSFATGLTGYIISLSAFDCENCDAQQRLLNADDLLR